MEENKDLIEWFEFGLHLIGEIGPIEAGDVADRVA